MKKYIVCILILGLMFNRSTRIFAEEINSKQQEIDRDMIVELDDDFLSIQTLDLNSISWNVNNNVEKRTRAFYMKRGKCLILQINISNIENVKVGIIDKEGEKKNVIVKKKINQTIVAPRTSKYRVFVSNKSGRGIKVSGSYSY